MKPDLKAIRMSAKIAVRIYEERQAGWTTVPIEAARETLAVLDYIDRLEGNLTAEIGVDDVSNLQLLLRGAEQKCERLETETNKARNEANRRIERVNKITGDAMERAQRLIDDAHKERDRLKKKLVEERAQGKHWAIGKPYCFQPPNNGCAFIECDLYEMHMKEARAEIEQELSDGV